MCSRSERGAIQQRSAKRTARIAPGSPFDFAHLADSRLRALRIKSPNHAEPSPSTASSAWFRFPQLASLPRSSWTGYFTARSVFYCRCSPNKKPHLVVPNAALREKIGCLFHFCDSCFHCYFKFCSFIEVVFSLFCIQHFRGEHTWFRNFVVYKHLCKK